MSHKQSITLFIFALMLVWCIVFTVFGAAVEEGPGTDINSTVPVETSAVEVSHTPEESTFAVESTLPESQNTGFESNTTVSEDDTESYTVESKETTSSAYVDPRSAPDYIEKPATAPDGGDDEEDFATATSRSHWWETTSGTSSDTSAVEAVVSSSSAPAKNIRDYAVGARKWLWFPIAVAALCVLGLVIFNLYASSVNKKASKAKSPFDIVDENSDEKNSEKGKSKGKYTPKH